MRWCPESLKMVSKSCPCPRRSYVWKIPRVDDIVPVAGTGTAKGTMQCSEKEQAQCGAVKKGAGAGAGTGAVQCSTAIKMQVRTLYLRGDC